MSDVSRSAPICISVINMKGGVGKTTIAALLGRYAAQRLKLQTLAIDLDPQANLSQTLMGESSYKQFLDRNSPSIVEVFNGYQSPTLRSPSSAPLDISDVVQRTSTPNLAVIPSKFEFSNYLSSAIGTDPMCLARIIAHNFQQKDLILIDCAPTESIFTQTAYHASRYVLVPVKPEFFATIGFPLLKRSLQSFRDQHPSHAIDVIGIVVNNSTYDGGNAGGPETARAMSEIGREARENGWQVFNSELGYSRGFPKMMRGDNTYLGSAERYFNAFASEFFDSTGLRGLRS